MDHLPSCMCRHSCQTCAAEGMQQRVACNASLVSEFSSGLRDRSMQAHFHFPESVLSFQASIHSVPHRCQKGLTLRRLFAVGRCLWTWPRMRRPRRASPSSTAPGTPCSTGCALTVLHVCLLVPGAQDYPSKAHPCATMRTLPMACALMPVLCELPRASMVCALPTHT